MNVLAERAKFWIARLSRDNRAEHADLIEFLRHASTNLGGVMLDLAQDNIPWLGKLTQLIEAGTGV